MTVALRTSGGPAHGTPLREGERVTYHPIDQEPRPGIRAGSTWELERWTEERGQPWVYARPVGHTPPAPSVAFRPSELGTYVGHEPGQPISAIKWGGPPDPSIKAAWIADAYRKARERARECPDPLLSRALGNGVQDFMLQIMKLVGAGAPAMDELLEAVTEQAEVEFKR